MTIFLAACILSWNPQPDATGFRVWRGTELLATVETNRATVQLPADQLSTITVTATNETGESEHSDPITVKPITPQTSENLTDWKPQKPFFIQAKPSLFFRFSYPSP